MLRITGYSDKYSVCPGTSVKFYVNSERNEDYDVQMVRLIHGDTNPFCLDKKFGGDTAPLLWRLNALGDYSVLDATVISVQPDNQKEPFSVTSLITKTPVGRTC